jgi:hypothetical protein
LVSFRIEQMGVTGARGLRSPVLSVVVADPKGAHVETVQETPMPLLVDGTNSVWW